MKDMTKTIDDPAQIFYKEKNKGLDLEREIDPYAMWAFVLSLGFLYPFIIPVFGIFVMPFCPFVSLALGIISLDRIKKRKDLKGKGFAIAAIIISSIQILIGLFAIVLGVSLIAAIF